MHKICKTFEFESGHVLSKSQDPCRFPHGHSRKVEVVLAAERLDANDMVCNFRWIKLALEEVLDCLDHAMCINSDDLRRKHFDKMGAKLQTFNGQDPTTEVLAKFIFIHLQTKLGAKSELTGRDGTRYAVPIGVRLEKVRLWETSSSWAEYFE